MSAGPHNISIVQRSNNVHMDTRILLRRARVELDHGQVKAAAKTLTELMGIYETECPSDQELYELDQWLITARRAIGKLFGPPDGPATANAKAA